MTKESVNLSFCNITVMDDFLVEVSINPHMEVGEAEIEEYHTFFSRFTHPVGVLENRSNPYAYSFAALRQIAMHENMAAIAILVPHRKIHYAKSDLTLLKSNVEIRVFTSRHRATRWLNQHQPEMVTA